MKLKKRHFNWIWTVLVVFCLFAPSQLLAADETVQWLNHLEFVTGDTGTSTGLTDSVGFASLNVTVADPGETSVTQGVQVPPGFLVDGVRLCYVVSNIDSFIDDVSLTQFQYPNAVIVLSDTNSLNSTDPVCVESALPSVPIDPSEGPLNLSLGMSFDSTDDSIVLMGVGLVMVPDPDAPIAQALQGLQDGLDEVNGRVDQVIVDLEDVKVDVEDIKEDLENIRFELEDVKDDLANHTHTYLTGKGTGHNNTVATSGSVDSPLVLDAKGNSDSSNTKSSNTKSSNASSSNNKSSNASSSNANPIWRRWFFSR